MLEISWIWKKLPGLESPWKSVEFLENPWIRSWLHPQPILQVTVENFECFENWKLQNEKQKLKFFLPQKVPEYFRKGSEKSFNFILSKEWKSSVKRVNYSAWARG